MPNPMIDLILAGAADEDIEAIYQAARQRRQIVAEQRALSLKPGDEFYIVNISPKYLEGCRVRFLKYTDKGFLQSILIEYTGRSGSNYGDKLNLRRSHVGRVISGGM